MQWVCSARVENKRVKKGWFKYKDQVDLSEALRPLTPKELLSLGGKKEGCSEQLSEWKWGWKEGRTNLGSSPGAAVASCARVLMTHVSACPNPHPHFVVRGHAHFGQSNETMKESDCCCC